MRVFCRITGIIVACDCESARYRGGMLLDKLFSAAFDMRISFGINLPD
jgi:hypothetical protein